MTNLQALKTELTDDPVSMGYLALTEANDVANANIINNTNEDKPRTVNQDEVDTGALRGVTTYDAFDGLVTSEQAWFEWLTANGVIPVTTHTLQQLAGVPVANDSIWAVAERTEMNAAMVALMQYQGSRAQEIEDTLGGSYVSPAEVRAARLLP